MKRRFLVQEGQPALDLIEEASLLLRQLPVEAWCAYLAGSLPFLAALLYFWADMSLGAASEDRLGPSALLLALLFVAAKLSQSRLAEHLAARARGAAPPPWGVRGTLRTTAIHLALQPWGLLLIPLALVATAPAGWVIAFFQTATVRAADPGASPRDVARRAWQGARRWQLQHHAVFSILSGLGFFLFLNLLALCFLIPFLLHTFLGIESTLTRSPWSTLNSTLLATLTGITLLMMDPLCKGVFVLREFQGDALHTGEDLRVALRRRRTQPALPGLLLLLLLLPVAQSPCTAADPPPHPGSERPPISATLPGNELDRAIDRTLEHPEYRWRLPRRAPAEASEGSDSGAWDRFWKWVGAQLKSAGDFIGRMLDKVIDWWRKLFRPSRPPAENSHLVFDWLSPVEVVAYAALALLLAAVGLQLARWLRDRRAAETPAAVQGIGEPPPDLRREEVSAAELPQEGWLQLGRDHLARGELRLALRAFHLASLARLASRQLITLARFKSNRDYRRELARRAHAAPSTLEDFDENLLLFERVWYGSHAVDAQGVIEFAARVERPAEGGRA